MFSSRYICCSVWEGAQRDKTPEAEFSCGCISPWMQRYSSEDISTSKFSKESLNVKNFLSIPVWHLEQQIPNHLFSVHDLALRICSWEEWATALIVSLFCRWKLKNCGQKIHRRSLLFVEKGGSCPSSTCSPGCCYQTSYSGRYDWCLIPVATSNHGE